MEKINVDNPEMTGLKMSEYNNSETDRNFEKLHELLTKLANSKTTAVPVVKNEETEKPDEGSLKSTVQFSLDG